MDDCAQKALISILSRAKEGNSYELALAKSFVDYQLKPYNIMKLHPDKILQIYQLIRKKFYSQAQINEIDFWVENQLRIFVWVVVVFAFVEQKRIEEFTSSQWNMLSYIFNNKSPITLQFQSLCLTRLKKSKKWSQQQIRLLDDSIRERSQKNRWNQIAKSIFISSNKKYFRTPKQCREQWLNHLDPTKTKSEWTLIEDYLLIKNIIVNGRKWSKVAKQLGNRRTEHMVKNRYKSLLNAEIKRLFDVDRQEILIAKIKQRLQSNSTVRKYINEKLNAQPPKQFACEQQNQKIPQSLKPTASIYEDIDVQSISLSKTKHSSLYEANDLQRSLIEIEIENNTKNQQIQKNNEEKWRLQQQPDIDELDIKQFFNHEILNLEYQPENLQFFSED